MRCPEGIEYSVVALSIPGINSEAFRAGLLNHMRANRQPLLHLLLLDAHGDGPFAC